MSEAIVTLKKGEGRMLKSGGLWIFDNEIASILGSFEDGDIVAVHDFDGYGLGKGFINRNSKIRVRMMTRNRHQEIDEAFLKMRVQEAWDYRKKVSDTGSCRVIFGEADFLPGLVVDKFSDVLVVQSLALGIDRLKDQIVELLMRHPGRVFPAEEIYQRVWGEETAYACENTVMVHIRRIREKVELNPSEPDYIKVVWGIGYKMERHG